MEQFAFSNFFLNYFMLTIFIGCFHDNLTGEKTMNLARSLKKKKKGGVWQWRYDFSHEKRRYRGWLGPTSNISKGVAEVMLSKIYADALSRKYTTQLEEGKSISIKEVFDIQMHHIKHHTKSWDSMKHRLRKGKRYFSKFDKIEFKNIREYQTKRLNDGVKGSTINRELDYFKTAFKRSIDTGEWKEGNPFSQITKIKFPENERTRFLSSDEKVRLLDKCAKSENRDLLDFVTTSMMTGMRFTNVAELKISEIDFKTGTITKTADQMKGKRVFTQPQSVFLMSVLNKRAERSARLKNEYIFPNPKTGMPYTDLHKAFNTALDRAGIVDFRFHDLRHTFASTTLGATQNLKMLAELMGHSKLESTMKYAHLLEKDKRNAMESIFDYDKSNGVKFHNNKFDEEDYKKPKTILRKNRVNLNKK